MLVLNKSLTPLPATPSQAAAQATETQLNIWVVFTSVESTLKALREAGALADRLGGRITVLVPQVVPYPLPLESPPILLDWTEKRFQLVCSMSPVETTVRIYLCRDRLDIAESISSASIVVVGSRKKLWPTFESRLVRKLRRSGHQVLLTEAE